MASTPKLVHFALALVIVLYADQITYDLGSGVVIWNVGQGQWATRYQNVSCEHFDAGGDRHPGDQIQVLCKIKSNRFWLSHWDLDHINLFPRIRKKLTRLCLMGTPSAPTSQRKQSLIGGLHQCEPSPNPSTLWIFEPKRRKNSNNSSRVAISGNWLLPGDSPKTEESHWVRKLRGKPIQRILLGHHGSRTSTGQALLKEAPLIQQSVASARRSRYNHPHQETRTALKGRGIALIETENWGSLRFPD